MKTKLSLTCLIAVCFSSSAATISQWTFENSPPADLANSATISGIAADSGNGTASGVHASASTDWSTPSGNASANSLSANTWAAGDYWQFHVNTIGFSDISISFDQTSSSTGPRNFKLSYSTDGTTFSDFDSYLVLANASAWNASSSVGALFEFDLGSIASLDNAASVFFRLVSGDTTAGGGTDRIDNVTVNGNQLVATTVPELSPGLAGWLGAVAFLFLARRRFRR
jgi:hypothetical protein